MMAVENMGLGCRMYEEVYPKVGTVVMVYVKEIQKLCIYVSLLEYNNIEGLLSFSKSEFPRRRHYEIMYPKIIKVGQIEPMKVLRVNPEMGYIDLTKCDLTDQEVQDCEERYIKSKIVHSTMRGVAQSLNMDLEEVYVLLGWPLYRKHSHAFEALQLIHSAPHMVNQLFPSENVKNSLVQNIASLKKIRATVELNDIHYDASPVLKKATRMAVGLELYCVVKIAMAAPLYALTIQTFDEEQGVLVLNNAIDSCTESIESRGGQLTVTEAPRVVIEHDD